MRTKILLAVGLILALALASTAQAQRGGGGGQPSSHQGGWNNNGGGHDYGRPNNGYNGGNRWNPQPRQDFGRDRGRPTISLWWNSGAQYAPPPVQYYQPPQPTFGYVNGVLCQLVQTQFGLQWVPVQTAPQPQYYPPQ